MGEWTVGAVFDTVADAVPNRLMTICGDRRSSYAEVQDRTRRIANFLLSCGLGAHREHAELAPWECGQDRIAVIMHNDLYLDVTIGCLKARTVPVNVNYNYTAREVGDLLAYIQPAAVFYHRALGARFAAVLTQLDAKVLVSVDDGSDAAELPHAVSMTDALNRGARDHPVSPCPDDMMMICTGGTTGRPKGVLWRQGDIYVSAMSGADHPSTEGIRSRVAAQVQPWFALSPLMHAAGMWTAFTAVLVGLPAILYDSRRPFDARTALQIAEREKASMMTMVGDAYAAPLVDELACARYDLEALNVIGVGGAATNVKYQEKLLRYLPHITLANGYGSSEAGNIGAGHSQPGSRKDSFARREGTVVVSHDYSRFLEPGDPEVGRVARIGRIPLGYFDDAAATADTFRCVQDRRVVIIGDRAQLLADGTLRLRGRDSLVINTGGEKVFVEEVEEVLRAHPAVADAVVSGRPSSRWGQEVAAAVALRAGAAVTGADLRDHCGQQLARFKIPKEFVIVDAVRRLGNGKADYRWAKQVVAQQKQRT